MTDKYKADFDDVFVSSDQFRNFGESARVTGVHTYKTSIKRMKKLQTNGSPKLHRRQTILNNHNESETATHRDTTTLHTTDSDISPSSIDSAGAFGSSADIDDSYRESRKKLSKKAKKSTKGSPMLSLDGVPTWPANIFEIVRQRRLERQDLFSEAIPPTGHSDDVIYL